MPAPDDALVFRPLRTPAEIRACIQLQELTWGAGFSERVPFAVLWFTQRIGGVLIGAFDAHNELIGFVFGVTGVREGRATHWSDMLAVRPEWRGRGLGLALKRAQREQLLRDGVHEAGWTFDPLEARNAHLNINRLGAVANEYIVELYGQSGSPMHVGIGTDRLVAHWRMDAPRAVERATGAASIAADRALPLVNTVRMVNGLPVPNEPDLAIDAARIAIAVPANIQALKQTSLDTAVLWRENTRASLGHYVERGFTVTGLQQHTAEYASYVLERAFSW